MAHRHSVTGRIGTEPLVRTPIPRGTSRPTPNQGLELLQLSFLYWDAERDMIRRLTGVNAEPTDSENQSGSGGSVFKRHRQQVRVGCAHSH